MNKECAEKHTIDVIFYFSSFLFLLFCLLVFPAFSHLLSFFFPYYFSDFYSGVSLWNGLCLLVILFNKVLCHLLNPFIFLHSALIDLASFRRRYMHRTLQFDDRLFSFFVWRSSTSSPSFSASSISAMNWTLRLVNMRVNLSFKFIHAYHIMLPCYKIN